MNWILNNWYILLAVAAILGAAGIAVYRFLWLPRETQLAKVREWLLWAVTRAGIGRRYRAAEAPAGVRPFCGAVPLAGSGSVL